MSIRQKTVQALAMAGVIAMVLFLAGCGGGGGGSSSNMITEEPMDTTPPTPDPMNDATTRDDEMLELFVQANGMDEDDPATMMPEAMRFGAALVAAADQNNGKPTFFLTNTMGGGSFTDLDPTPTATWAAGAQLQIRITPTTTYFPELMTDFDEQDDPMNFNMIDGLGDFMHGFEIERMGVGDANPLDQAKAIIFTDKQPGTAAIEAVSVVDAGSLTNQAVGTGNDAVMFDVSDVSDNGNTISNVMFFESSTTVEDPGSAYMGTLTCPATTSCSYEVAANGDITTIVGYRFTGTREARAMVEAVDAMENNDYLVFGLWLLENNQDEWESIGAIAGGGMPISGTQSFIDNVAALTGQATYTGKAFGAHHMDGMTSWFDADASITMDWDASPSTTGWGTVMGEISNIRIAGGTMHEDSIYLRADGSGGEFTGTAAMGAESRPNMGDYPFSGGWTAQLFGTGASGDYPNAVAGTFGVTNMDETETFVGAFGARME